MRRPFVFIAFLLFSFTIVPLVSAATTNVYYRALCTAADGSPIGLLKVAEDELGNQSGFRFAYEDDVLVRVDVLRDGTRVSSSQTYKNGRPALVTGYSEKGPEAGPTSERTYEYDENGRLTHETYARYEKGEARLLWTKDYAYDEAGVLTSVVENNASSGGRHEAYYQNGLEVERRASDRNGRHTTIWKYTYGPRTGPIWLEEQRLDADGEVRESRTNPMLEAGSKVERQPLRLQKTVGDEEVPVTHVEITNPFFSPTNSPHRKDDTRISACLGPTRPLTFQVFSEGQPDSPVFVDRTPIAGGTGYFYYWWVGVNAAGEAVADGRYPFIVRTPVVRAWVVRLWEKRRYTQEPLLCVVGQKVYVYDGVQAKVVVFGPGGDLEREIELAPCPGWGTESFYPMSMNILPDGRIFLSWSDSLYVYDGEGNLLRQTDAQLEGLMRAVGWAVDAKGGVYCVVANSHRVTKAGKETYYDDYAVLKLDEAGRTERVVVNGSGFYPDAKPFMRDGLLYINFWHHAEEGFQRYLGIVDLEAGDMKLLPRTDVVSDIMRTDAGDLYLQGGPRFHDSAGQLVRGFDCGSGCTALSGNALYALANIGTELRRYDLDSDRILLQDVLVVDNTTPTAIITYPGSQGLVAGDADVVEITGTAADLNFEKYEIFWKLASDSDDSYRWRLLVESATPCDNGVLAVWDTTKLHIRNIKDRDIELKLIVTDKAGNTIEERFSLRYDADDDGFSNEFELSNKELDRNKKTERRTAEIAPDVITMLTRRFPINKQVKVAVQVVDAQTREVLNKGVLTFSVNAGNIWPRSSVSPYDQIAPAYWQTPDHVVTPATLHVELPPQGVNNVYYTAEPMEMDFVLVVDSDFDGLTDDEENTIEYPGGLKTSPTDPDSDDDDVDDYRDLSPKDKPAVQFTTTYQPGELRFKQTYRILAVAGSQATVIKDGDDMGRDAIMDKEITDDTVKGFFNDKVFKISSENEEERSPLQAQTATNRQTYTEESLWDLDYEGFSDYTFKYYLEQYLYELVVTNRVATSFPLGYGPKYATLKLDVTWRYWGDNAVVVQFTGLGADHWRDEDEAGNSTKLFLKYELYRRGKVAEEFPHYTGLAAVDRIETETYQHIYQSIIQISYPDACPRGTGISNDQTVVITPLWVRHKGGNLPCAIYPKIHPEITPDRDECLFCGYRPVRDEFSPVSAEQVVLSAFAHQFNHYSYCVIGRLTARAGGPPVDPTTDYETMTAIFDRFNPATQDGPSPANGIVPATIGGRSYSICFCEENVIPGSSGDFDAAQFIYDRMPSVDAVVLRSNSGFIIDTRVDRLKNMLLWETPPWLGEWVFVPEGTDTNPPSGAIEISDAAGAEASADAALDKMRTLGARFKLARQTATFLVDCSNLPLVGRADQFAAQTNISSMRAGSSVYNVVAEKLADGKFGVQLTQTKDAVANVRCRTAIVRTEPPVDDITKSKIAQQYGVVNKIPTVILAGAKIGTAVMTDGIDAYQAFRAGDYWEAGFYGVRCGANVTLAVCTVAFKNSPLLKTIQVTKFAKVNVAAAVISGIEVGYDVFRAVRADSWLERSQYTEKAFAAAIDGAIACVEPYGAAITLSWQASVWATNKVCDKFGIGESTSVSRAATRSIGAAIVFVFKDLSPFNIPTEYANDAYTRVKDLVEGKVTNTNKYLDDRNRDEPRWIFIPPDAPTN